MPTLVFGDSVVSNLSEPYRASSLLGSMPPEVWGTQSFMTDGVSYSLDSIQTIMGSALNSPVAVFELRKDTGANEIDMTAGGFLTSFAAPSLTGANSVRDFFPTSSVQLDPNTQYWFMAGITNNGTFEWDYANTGFFMGPGSLTEFGDSLDSGTTWNYPVDPFFPWYLQVNATRNNVPEPAMSGLLLAGLAIAANRRRRSR